MRITAQLAYNQLKINRSRTIWSVVAITLSTALLTAICNFLASGNALLVTLLGKSYGEYGKSYEAFLLIPVIIFGILIMSMSITVISNVFRVSAQDRISQFGVLKCTGATPRQIKETVMYESAWLCLLGIPLGFVLGFVFSIAGIGVANYFLADFNALAHLMIQEISISLHFVFSWQAILFSVGSSILIVLFSAWRPAHKAAKIAAIQCIHGANEVKVEEKAYKNSKLVEKFFGFEGTLAHKNLKRNHRNFRATVISLSVGVTLFVSLGALVKQAQAIQDFMSPDIKETVIAEYTSDYEDRLIKSTGNYERKYLHPIDSSLGEEITQIMEKQKGISIWGMGNDMDTYRASIQGEDVTREMQTVYKEQGKRGKAWELPVEILTLDTQNYKKLCAAAKVPVGSNILLNNYSYNDFGNEKNVEPLVSSIRTLKLVKADGSSKNVTVQGMLSVKQLPAELIYPGTQPVRIVMEQAPVRGFSWYCAPENEKNFMEYANQVLAKYFPGDSSHSYSEKGFNTRVFRMDEYMQVMNIAISLVSVFMYSFAALLMLIGITNVISTLSTNVLMRAKEFAVLKSVGMTPEGLHRMLNFESVLCSLKALIIGVPAGLLISVLINIPIRKMYPVCYHLPWMSVILCILMVLFITWGTIRYASHKLENQNLIETIRSACGK